MKANELRPKLNFKERAPYLEEGLFFVPTFYDRHHEFCMPNFHDERIFSKEIPVNIEFCSGNGEWIIQAAKNSPDIGWVAVEMQFSRVRKIYAKTRNLGLTNLLVVWGRGEDFIDHYLKSDSIDRVFVHFPDPWPKQRHAKHRIIQKDFCQQIKRILKKEGSFHLITDDLNYRDQMLDIINIAFESIDEDFWLERSQDFSSYFYRLWKSLDRKIYSLNYKKRSHEELFIDVSHENTLNIDDLILSAENVIQRGNRIVWVFDFKHDAHELSLLNEALYSSYKLTFQTLRERVFERYEDSSAEFRIYDAALDFTKIKTFSAMEQNAFDVYCDGCLDLATKKPLMALRHFYLEIFVDFLSCLASYLPIEIHRSIHIDLQTTLSSSEFADLFSLRNFQDLDVRITRARIVSHRLLTNRSRVQYENALIIPSLAKIDHAKLGQQIQALEKRGLEFCLVPEERIVEHWHGLETLYFCKNSITEVGLRAIEGFQASMGEIQFL